VTISGLKAASLSKFETLKLWPHIELLIAAIIIDYRAWLKQTLTLIK
jgi:hypothetical protein